MEDGDRVRWGVRTQMVRTWDGIVKGCTWRLSHLFLLLICMVFRSVRREEALGVLLFLICHANLVYIWGASSAGRHVMERGWVRIDREWEHWIFKIWNYCWVKEWKSLIPMRVKPVTTQDSPLNWVHAHNVIFFFFLTVIQIRNS